jgi:hypothetical protein
VDGRRLVDPVALTAQGGETEDAADDDEDRHQPQL